MRKNPGVAAVLSFFFVGAGQIYNGRILKGILMVLASWTIGAFVLAAILAALSDSSRDLTGWLCFFALLGFTLWVYGIVDAYKTAVKINEEMERKEGRDEVTKTSS